MRMLQQGCAALAVLTQRRCDHSLALLMSLPKRNTERGRPQAGTYVDATEEGADGGGLVSLTSDVGARGLVSIDLLLWVVQHGARVAAVSYLHNILAGSKAG